MLSIAEICILKKPIQDIFGNILKGKKKKSSDKHVEWLFSGQAVIERGGSELKDLTFLTSVFLVKIELNLKSLKITA